MNDAKTGDQSIGRIGERRAYSLAELIADGIVHGVGLAIALVAGTVLVTFARIETAPEAFWSLLAYVVSLVALLGVSMAFNLWPAGHIKAWLARFDQAAIFLFIAGSYTPFLAVAQGEAVADRLLIFVWAASLIGIALKLVVPHRFGRLAIVLYLAIGWSGVVAFQALAQVLPASSLWLLVAGGLAYSMGIVFHLWERLRFQNVVWHVFVVAGATLHLMASIDTMVLNRL